MGEMNCYAKEGWARYLAKMPQFKVEHNGIVLF
jgi:hypothetical protein